MDDINILPKYNDLFLKEFLKVFLSNGFGSLSKRDIDILLMSLLTKYSDLDNKSNFDLSVKLKLTEAKVKSLRYEASIKYASNYDLKSEFLVLLKIAKLKIIGKDTYISISVEDKYLRNSLKSKIKKNGSFTDSTFNSEIMKISVEDFIYLLDEFSDEIEKKEFQENINSLFPTVSEISFPKLCKIFIEKVAESAGNELGKQGISLVMSNLTGGYSTLIQIVESLKKSIK